MLFNKNIIIEKYSSLNELYKLNHTITFHENDVNFELIKQLRSFLNVLSEHLDVNENDLTKMFFSFKENVDYIRHGSVIESSIDFDDWNFLMLYKEFAIYSKTKKIPFYLFEDKRYGEYNKEIFYDFLKGNNKIFKIKK